MKNVLAIQSHVVYGFAGNKSATFPMQLLGVDVWALNTVQFSNHTQYGKWTGMVIPQEQIGEIANGLDAIGKPLLYRVTDEFLDAFQLEVLKELPELPQTRANSEELFEGE